MATITFSHSKVGTLSIDTGANQIAWSYGINTQSYPTYGGEVVQILGAYIDNISIQGEVRTYAKAEQIYSYFIDYLQKATQGTDGTRYTQEPMVMRYPERHWEIQIQPVRLPGFQYGTEVVVPSYQIEAVVKEPAPEMLQMAKRMADLGKLHALTADMGFDDTNPWSDPQFAKEGEKKYLGQGQADKQRTVTTPAANASPLDLHDFFNKVGTFYDKLITDISGNNFDSLIGPNYSQPTTKPSATSTSNLGGGRGNAITPGTNSPGTGVPTSVLNG